MSEQISASPDVLDLCKQVLQADPTLWQLFKPILADSLIPVFFAACLLVVFLTLAFLSTRGSQS